MHVPGYSIDRSIQTEPGYTVYRARRDVDQAPVLLKLVDSSGAGTLAAIDRLEWEYELTRSLSVDGILHAYELIRCPAGDALVLEDRGALPLYSAIERDKLDVDSALEIVLGLAGTIDRLHRQNLVHKAIHPKHVFLDPVTRNVWVTGFEAASRLPDDSPNVGQRRLSVERLAYMAPEQTGRMNRRVDFQADLYSIGVLFYELVTGCLPFDESDPLHLIHAHIARVPKSPSALRDGISRPVSAIIMKLLAKAEEDRYQTASGLCADLAACLAGGLHPDFTPGRHDVSDQIRIPQKLYGREAELQSLMSAFERAAGGRTEFLLVAGYSGIGKSALVHEVHKPIVRQKGYFTFGKFDQFKRNIPHSAVINAFRDLTRLILTESADDVATWRSRLLEAVELNGQIIINVIPEIELIIGPQPAVPDLPPAETKNRFTRVFLRFIRVFAQAEHPLVLFLDDLQWADGGTLELLCLLAEDQALSHALIVGAYRDNEVRAGHPLLQCTEDIESAGVTISRLELKPLRPEDLNDFVADTLRSPPGKARDLAKLIQAKTDGNPFFTVQFIKLMYAEKCLIFDHSDHYWHYDLTAINRLGVTDNVVDLMIHKIRQLPGDSQDAIKLAACVGDSFDIETLSVISQEPTGTVAARLQPAIGAGLVVPTSQESVRLAEFGRSDRIRQPTDVTYKFLHDRVQQAAYALIPDGDRPRVHLQIGQLLRGHSDAAALAENIFEITGHLNAGAGLLRSKRALTELANLNLTAGRRAKASTAYEAALSYFETGCGHLSADAWSSEYQLAFALHLERAETEYLCGNFDCAEEQLVRLLDLARSAVDKGEIYRIRIVQYENTSRFPEARDWGKTGLALFDIRFPEEQSQRLAFLDNEIAAIRKQIGDRPIADLVNLPVMTDSAMRIAMKLLMTMWAPSYISGDMVLTALIAAKMVHLSLQYGNIGESSYGYVTYGATIGLRNGDYQSSYEFGRLALAVNEALDDLGSRAKVNHMFSCYIGPWRMPIRDCFEYSREAYKAGLASGDLIYAAYGIFHEGWHGLFSGQRLADFQNTYAPYLTFMEITKNQSFFDTHQLILQWGLAYEGKTHGPCSLSGDNFDEAAYLKKYEQFGFFLSFYHTIKMHLFYRFGRFSEALDSSLRAKALADKTEGMIWDAWGCFYRALTLTACGKPRDVDECQRIRDELQAALQRFRTWARTCPENFSHRCALLEAEIAAFDDDGGKAIDAYDTAIAEASHHGFIQIEALANECCARYWMNRGNRDVAGIYLRAAEHCYVRWGANAKVDDIRQRYAEVREPSDAARGATPYVADFDWTTVVRAAQIISGEVEEQQLLEKLLYIVLENAGAQRGFILLDREGTLRIEAEAEVDQKVSRPDHSLPDDSDTRIARSVIRYVARVGSSLVLADASLDDRFLNDPYILERKPLSILCTPIQHKGRTIGLVYLENNLARDAFSPGRTEVVTMLAAQAAISIENARLYQNMKQEIAERTFIEGRLRSVAEATSPVVGSDYFKRLVEHLAEAFGVRYALISRCTDDANTHVRTLAFWKGDGFGEDFEYALTGTPCEHVICGSVLKHGERLQAHFPNDAGLVELNAESYLGIPLFDSSGKVIGHLAIIDDKPMSDRKSDMSIMNIFAVRAGAELERNRAAEELQAAHDLLEARVSARTEQLSDANQKLQKEISERQVIEERLQDAKDAAEASSQAKSRFLANMSHELRTPLNAILGYAQILKRDKTLAESHRHDIATIESSGEHLLALIDDVLSLSKIEAGKLSIVAEEFKLESLLQSVLDIARIRAQQKGIEFRYRPDRFLPVTVRGAQRALRQVLLNLLGNAIKFTDAGFVTLEVSYEAPGPDAPRLRFAVSDTGIGIPPDHYDQIFDPFHQLEHKNRRDEGTGLGLAISRSLVELMGSRIDVQSTPGAGSTFAFELQLQTAEDALSVQMSRPVEGYEGPRRRALIVDDSTENRAVLSGMLKPLGFEIMEAQDGETALSLAKDWRPDVVLMDIVMPVMDGLEATRLIRESLGASSPTIIALSASVFERDQVESASAGCDDFVPKPVRQPQLLESLRRHLNLTWVHGPERTDTAEVDAASLLTLHGPAQPELENLQRLAAMGDVNGIIRALDDAVAGNSALLPFANAVRHWVSRFEIRQLNEYLTLLSANASPPIAPNPDRRTDGHPIAE